MGYIAIVNTRRAGSSRWHILRRTARYLQTYIYLLCVMYIDYIYIDLYMHRQIYYNVYMWITSSAPHREGSLQKQIHIDRVYICKPRFQQKKDTPFFRGDWVIEPFFWEGGWCIWSLRFSEEPNWNQSINNGISAWLMPFYIYLAIIATLYVKDIIWLVIFARPFLRFFSLMAINPLEEGN